MPGNRLFPNASSLTYLPGAQKRDVFDSTDWFREESYFSIAAAFTERLVETRTCFCLSWHAFGLWNKRLGWRIDTSRPESVCHRRKRRENTDSIAFPSLLRFAEGVSPVGDRTVVGRLELLVGVVHCSGESTSFPKGSLQRPVITVQKVTTLRTCQAQERQDNSGKFSPLCKPSFSTSAAKTPLSWPDTASSSLFFNLFKTETTGTLFLWGGFNNFLQKRQVRLPFDLHFPVVRQKPMHQRAILTGLITSLTDL